MPAEVTALFPADPPTTQQALLDRAAVIEEQMAALTANLAAFREALSACVLQVDSGSAALAKKPHAIKALLTAFDAKHQAVVIDPESGRGLPAPINGAKDAAIMKRLLGRYPADQILACMDLFFADDDDWLRKAGYTVGVFASRLGGLLVQRSAPAPIRGVTANTKPNHQQAAVGASLIKTTYGHALR